MKKCIVTIGLLCGLVQAQSTRSVTFNWNPSPSPAGVVAGYNVYVGLMDSSCTGTLSKNNSTLITGTTYPNVLLPFGQYCVGATAVDSNGLESAMSPKVAFNAPPRTPVLTCTGSTCTWTDTNPATVTYKVWGYIPTGSTCGAPSTASSNLLTATPIANKTITIQQTGTICVFVTSYIKTSVGDLDGAPSNVAGLTIAPLPPGAPTITLQIAGTYTGPTGSQVAFNSITLKLGN